MSDYRSPKWREVTLVEMIRHAQTRTIVGEAPPIWEPKTGVVGPTKYNSAAEHDAIVEFTDGTFICFQAVKTHGEYDSPDCLEDPTFWIGEMPKSPPSP